MGFTIISSSYNSEDETDQISVISNFTIEDYISDDEVTSDSFYSSNLKIDDYSSDEEEKEDVSNLKIDDSFSNEEEKKDVSNLKIEDSFSNEEKDVSNLRKDSSFDKEKDVSNLKIDNFSLSKEKERKKYFSCSKKIYQDEEKIKGKKEFIKLVNNKLKDLEQIYMQN